MAIDKQQFSKQLGKSIATYRQKCGFTQEELAEQLGIGNEAVSRIERGVAMPSIMRLLDIADILSCHLSDLLTTNSLREKDQMEYTADLLKGLSEKDRKFIVELIKQLSIYLKKS